MIKSIVGQKFGKLTVTGRADNDRFERTRWNCICECGKETVVAYFRMKSGHTKSCGCAKKGPVTHGKSRTKTHNSWLAMKQRCQYEGHPEFHRYGAAGIKVCERWNNSFESFLEDMGEKPDGMSLDRINSSGNYEPGNCRWATTAQQNRNRKSNINITHNGKTMCVRDWCHELGLNADRVYGYIRRGVSPKEALFK